MNAVDTNILVYAVDESEPKKGSTSLQLLGERLFQQPNHDVGLIEQSLPNTPIAGFFAAGEIGPVGGKTFIHGLTSSLILLHPA